MPKFAQFKIELYIQIQIYTVLHAQVELLFYLQRMRFELLAAGSVGLSLLVLTTPLRKDNPLIKWPKIRRCPPST